MAELIAPLVTASVFLPLAAAAVVAKIGDESRSRGIAVNAAGVSLLCSIETLREVMRAGGAALAEPWSLSPFSVGQLGAAPMVLFAAIALVTLMVAPRRDTDRRFLVSALILLSSTLAAYAADNLIVFFAAWIGSATPFLRGTKDWRGGRIFRLNLIAGAVSLAAAVTLIEVTGARAGATAPLSISELSAAGDTGGPLALALLMLAAILHSGLFPAHRIVMGAFDGAPILLSALSMNSQLGVFLIARVALSLFPELAADALPWLSGLALFTSVYTALLGIVERDPRRLLSIIMVSQCSAILAGLAAGSPEGYTGALVQWIVVALASTALISIYRSVEARIGGNPGSLRFLGLAAQMPRLAVFFAVSGLALIGLPGTLGFAGQHLLVHGMLAAHSWWGVALPIAIALNAYHVFVLFTHLFLGKPVFSRSSVPDALPRERWALSAFIVLLIWGGLAPDRVVALREIAVGAVSRAHGEPGSTGPGK